MVVRRKGNRSLQISTVDDIAASVGLEEGWINKLLELPGDELAKVLGDIADHSKITTAAFRKARSSLPSFSRPRLTDFAERFGLPNSLENTEFEPVVTPVYNLPPSVHEIMFEAAWHTQDVYQEKCGHIGEKTFRILDPVCQRLAKLSINLSLLPVHCSHHRTLSRSNHWQARASHVRD
jgi:DNA polymerase III epsilon subunit-like protein